MSNEVLNRKELMAMLGYKDKDSFRKRLRYLTEFEQFPPNLPSLPNKWSRQQIAAWIAGVRPQAVKHPSPVANTQKPISSLQARLMARKLQIIDGGQLYNN